MAEEHHMPSIGRVLSELIRQECRVDLKKWPDELINELVREVWCVQTARPDVRDIWVKEVADVGQDDVTAYVLCKAYHSGTIARVPMDGGGVRFVNWAPNGEGVSYHDHVHPYMRSRIGEADRGWFPSEFLLYADSLDWELGARAAIFEQRLREIMVSKLSVT